jgi:membrane-associated phospholipid phosphatase
MPITMQPTKLDFGIAHMIARHSNPSVERAAGFLTWGADENVLCGLAIVGWLWAHRGRSSPAERLVSNHLLLTSLAAASLPHLLKRMFDQRRPDRLTVRGHLHGIPFSGRPLDAFPSGHAVHLGALASAASELPRAPRNAVWAMSGGVALTRIVLLAHWTSDVVCGFVIGIGVERFARYLTGFGHATGD